MFYHLGICRLVLILFLVFSTVRLGAEQYVYLELESFNDYVYNDFAFSKFHDFDGDSIEDFLLGLPRKDIGVGTRQGESYLVSGKTREPLVTFISPSPSDDGNFGNSLSSVPDLNGDGIDDIIIGADHERASGVFWAGRAHVFDGVSGSLLYSIESPTPDDRGHFGRVVCGIDDINGDGRGDILVGAPHEEFGAEPNSVGRAYLFDGTSGTLVQTFMSLNPSYAGGWGFSIANLKDITGDGVSDFAISSSGESRGGDPDDCGYLYVYNGATQTIHYTLASPNKTLDGYFSSDFISIDSVDGNQGKDLAISANGEEKTYIIDSATSTLIETINSPTSDVNAAFGNYLSTIPDVSGDGRQDLIISAYLDSYDSFDRVGRVFVYQTSPTFQLMHKIKPPAPISDYMFFGGPLLGSDFDGDGIGEFITKSRRLLYLYDMDSPHLGVLDNGTTISFNGLLDFGDIPLGGPNLSHSITVANNGFEALVTSNTFISTPVFLSEPIATTITLSSSDTFTIDFPSTTQGFYNGSISFESNDLRYPIFSFNYIYSVGMPEIEVFTSSTLITDGFTTATGPTGSIETGTTYSFIFQVNNVGNDALQIFDIEMDELLSISEPLDSIIPALSSDTFTVDLFSGDAGEFTKNITIYSNDPDETTITFSLFGGFTGSEIAYELNNGMPLYTTSTIDLGEAVVGTGDLSDFIRIRNSGTQTLYVTTMTLSAPFYTTRHFPFSVSHHGSDNRIVVLELPDDTVGDFQTSVTLISDDANETTFTFNLIGSFLPRPVVFVDKDAPEGGDGLSWATAKKTITEGINVFGDHSNVWVAEGGIC